MTDHVAQAEKLFAEGYNCAQAVFAAFCDVTGLEFTEALRMSSVLGGGMGRMREVCGAVSGMLLVAGHLRGYDSPTDKAAKTELYALVQRLAGEFRAERGSIICRELLTPEEASTSPVPSERTAEYMHARVCPHCVATAAKIAEKLLNQQEQPQ